MPLEVVVELQIRAISCPGVFLPDKHDVFLGVYLLNQYLETDCFPSMFPIMVQRSMRFGKVNSEGTQAMYMYPYSPKLSSHPGCLNIEKSSMCYTVFENAIDPGAVADILESFLTRFELIQLVSPVWQELAYYEENTRDFLFPEPRLTPSHPGMCREVLMKTVEGFPGIAPKIEFSTRTAIRERVFLHRNRFFEERRKSQRPLCTPNGPKFPLSCVKMKPRESNLDRVPPGMQSRPLSPYCTRRFFQDQPAQLNLGYTFKIPGESKPPFVVDSAKPFGENSSQHHSQKSRRKPNFSNFPFPVRRVSSLDSLGANVKVIKEPDERIVLRNESPSSLDSSKFGKPSPSYSNQGDADFHQETSFDTSQNSRSPSPLLDQPLLRERPHPGFQSTWKKIHERVCSLLTSHRAQQHLNKEESISEIKNILDRPGYPLKKYRAHEQKYF